MLAFQRTDIETSSPWTFTHSFLTQPFQNILSMGGGSTQEQAWEVTKVSTLKLKLRMAVSLPFLLLFKLPMYYKEVSFLHFSLKNKKRLEEIMFSSLTIPNYFITF